MYDTKEKISHETIIKTIYYYGTLRIKKKYHFNLLYIYMYRNIMYKYNK